MPGIISDTAAVTDQQSKSRKPSKNEQRRAKKKAQKLDAQNTASLPPDQPGKVKPNANQPVQPTEPAADDPVQNVPDVAPFAEDDPLFSQFAGVFAKFNESNGDVQDEKVEAKAEVFYDDEDMIQDEEEEAATKKKLSKKQRKNANKLSIAELKAMVEKPEIVEWTDIDSHDPKLLVNIKSTRNMVPVPAHWSLKREYLSSKRGIEKQNFRLPQFIAETGIAEMRQNALDASAEKSLKQKARERVNPAMNRLDIDYQKLFEAFFRRQTKPHLTRYGEIYYEGKEYETDLRHLRPGDMTDALLEGLNMPVNAPPPWLINMQKLGCPPSYPAMKIPGVNAPLPPGGKWGFEPGQWGKPPVVDEVTMRPQWGGDLFGNEEQKRQQAKKTRRYDAPVSRAHWGELVEEQEPEAEEEDEDEADEAEEETGKEEDIGMTGTATPFAGVATPSGFHTTATTQSMAGEFDLRKKRSGIDSEHAQPRAAGQVLREKSIRTEGFFGGSHAYDIHGADVPVLGTDDDRSRKRKAADLDISVDVDALEQGSGLSKDQIRQRYDENQQRGRPSWQGKVDQDDLSNMIAEENAKRLRKNDDQRRHR